MTPDRVAEAEVELREILTEHRYIRDAGFSGCRCAKVQFSSNSWDEDWQMWLEHVYELARLQREGKKS